MTREELAKWEDVVEAEIRVSYPDLSRFDFAPYPTECECMHRLSCHKFEYVPPGLILCPCRVYRCPCVYPQQYDPVVIGKGLMLR